jgi:hypothetical protein
VPTLDANDAAWRTAPYDDARAATYDDARAATYDDARVATYDDAAWLPAGTIWPATNDDAPGYP